MSDKNFSVFPNIVRQGLFFWVDTNYDASACTGDVGSGHTWVNLVGSTFSYPGGQIGNQNMAYAGDASDRTITGAAFDDVPTHGYSFGGGGSADQHFASGHTGTVNNLTDFTIEIWSKLKGSVGVSCGMIAGQVDVSSTSRNDTVFGVRYAQSSGPARYPDGDDVSNIIIVGLGDGQPVPGTESVIQYESAGDVQSNEWQQIVYTSGGLDVECGSMGFGEPSTYWGLTHGGKLFIDGVQDVPSGKKAYGCSPLIAKGLDEVAANLKIGVGELSGTDAGKNWHGEIGCVRIYDRSLSQEEIVQNYIATHRRFPAPIPQNIPYYDRSIQRPFGDMMAFTEGILNNWGENQGWWNIDDGDGWTFNHAAGEFLRSSAVLRVDDDQGRGHIRISLEQNNYSTTDEIYALYPKSFCRAIIGNNYYYFPVQNASGNDRQFFWEPVNSLNWTKENIRDNGNFGWNANTPVRIEIWSGETPADADADGPGQEQP
jgi:hypothetical protein